MLSKSSIMFKFITLIILSPLVAESVYTNSCQPLTCGNGTILISSPFWIPQQQESHCGSSGFEITCEDQNPVIKISENDYVVLDIFYANKTLSLVSKEAYDVSDSCPIPTHNFTLDDGSPFNFSDSDVSLYFFYNCSSDFNLKTYTVNCSTDASSHSFATFHEELVNNEGNYSIGFCKSIVNAPVTGDTLDVLLHMTYTQVLRRGFSLEWGEANYKCSNCSKSKSLSVGQKIGIVFGAGGFGIMMMLILFYFYHRRGKNRYAYSSSCTSRNISSRSSSKTDLEKAGTYHGIQIFKYSELEKATNYFDSKKELGDGGFGTVYHGVLKDGRVVAVKRLYENNYRRVEQFMNEVEILTRLRHPNLVSLYGCTSREIRELLLVYEFVPNGTVADHLHGEKAKPGSLIWNTRMRIAIETASALVYLHKSEIIHRDVKTTNILLDENFGVKVADFGLSRLFPINMTHVSTAPQGTPGYVDPEYHECYQLTDKSDVYSFGVVLIELISSLPAVDITRHRHNINLSNMAINKIRNNALHELVDPCLGYDSDEKVRKMIDRIAELAFQCLQGGKEMRPCMDEVLEVLKGIQSVEHDKEKNGELSITTNTLFLKNDAQEMSPDSVTVIWATISETSNSSG